MRLSTEAEIKDTMDKWFTKKEILKKTEPVIEKADSEYSQSQIGMNTMWEKAIEDDRDERNLTKAKTKLPQQDKTLEKFGAQFKEEQIMTIPQANDWILKNQGKAPEILQQKFTEKMQNYDKFKRDFSCNIEDFEMVSVQGQV